MYVLEEIKSQKVMKIHTILCPIYVKKVDNTAIIWHDAGDTLKQSEDFIKKYYSSYTVEYCTICNPKEPLNLAYEKTFKVSNFTLEQLWDGIYSLIIELHVDVEKKEDLHLIEGSINRLYITDDLTSFRNIQIGSHYSANSLGEKIRIALTPEGSNIEVNFHIALTYSKNWKTRIQSILDGYPNIANEFVEEVKKRKVEVVNQREIVSNNIHEAFSNLLQPSTPIMKISSVVYDNAPQIKLVENTAVVALAFSMIAIFYGYYFWSRPEVLLNNSFFLILTYAVAAVFLYLMYRSDNFEKEPLSLILICFSWGIFSGLIAAPVERLLEPFFGRIFFFGSEVAPFVEEPIKAFGLYLLLSNKKFSRGLNTPLDGIIYGFSVGIGFFAMENFFYFLSYGAGNLIIRCLLCWGHGVYTATVGLWLANARVQYGKIGIKDIAPGLIVAVSLHFVWNGLAEANDVVGGLLSYLVLAFASAELLYLFKIVREARRDEALWGFSRNKIGKS